MSKVKVSIIVPTHQRHSSLKELLGSLESQELPENQWEVLVVSNLDDSKTQALCLETSLANCLYYFVGQVGVNRARNKGIARARGEVLLFIDDDCMFPDPGYLGRLVQMHCRHENIHGLGGRYLLATETSHWVARAYQVNTDRWLDHSLGEGPNSPQLLGGCASYKREVFQRGYLFDENVVFGGAETGLNARLVRAGFQLYILPELSLIHKPEIHLAEFLKKAFLQGVGARRDLKITWVAPRGETSSLPSTWSVAPPPKALVLKGLLLAFDFAFQVGYLYFEERQKKKLASPSSGHLPGAPIIS